MLRVSFVLLCVFGISAAWIRDCQFQYKIYHYISGGGYGIRHHNAPEVCNQQGYDHAIVRDESSFDAAKAIMGRAKDAWLGATRHDNCPSKWIWADGTCMDWSFMRWEDNEQNSGYSGRNCLMMSDSHWSGGDGNGNYRWKGHTCDADHIWDDHHIGILCQKCLEMPETCPDPSDRFNRIIACDTRYSDLPLTCKYIQTTGTKVTNTQSQGGSQGKTITNETSSDLEDSFSKKLGYSETTEHDWRFETSTTYETAVSTELSLTCQPGYKCELDQVTGYCGIYAVNTAEFRLKTTKRTSRSMTVEVPEYIYGASVEEIQRKFNSYFE